MPLAHGSLGCFHSNFTDWCRIPWAIPSGIFLLSKEACYMFFMRKINWSAYSLIILALMPTGPRADIMVMSSIASVIYCLFYIIVCNCDFWKTVPFCSGFNDTSGMSFAVVKTDLYCWLSMLAIFLDLPHIYFLLSKVLFYLYIFCIYFFIKWFGIIFNFILTSLPYFLLTASFLDIEFVFPCLGLYFFFF